MSASEAGASGGYAKGRARREQIVAAAAAAYADTGYHGSSLREIAKRTGISHSTLLYHFPSRELLLAAVLERRDEQDHARLAPKVPSPLGVVRHLLDIAGHNSRRPGIVELYVRLAAEAYVHDHPAHEYFLKHYAQIRAYARDAFQELAEQGLLREGVDARQAAVSVVALMDGLQVQWLTGPQDVDMEGALRFFVGQLLKDPLEPSG